MMVLWSNWNSKIFEEVRASKADRQIRANQTWYTECHTTEREQKEHSRQTDRHGLDAADWSRHNPVSAAQRIDQHDTAICIYIVTCSPWAMLHCCRGRTGMFYFPRLACFDVTHTSSHEHSGLLTSLPCRHMSHHMPTSIHLLFPKYTFKHSMPQYTSNSFSHTLS